MYEAALRQTFRAALFPVDRYGPAHWKPSSEVIGELRLMSYKDQWKHALMNEWYHVMLEDHSLFIFDEANGNSSYNFIHAPVLMETLGSYLKRRGIRPSQRNRDIHLAEYELLFETAQCRSHVTPIRYDLDHRAYTAGVHPAAHMHIGLENEIRLGIRRQLSPLAFTMFVMRQMYPNCWRRLLDRFQHNVIRRQCRDELRKVSDEHWSEIDELELHFI